MTEPTDTPYPQTRTPEQHDAVRRRALPVASCGVILGALGLVLLLIKQVGAGHPPNVVAVNLSFCAMMMGVGILFYIKSGGGTPGTRAAPICTLAILLGLVGPVIFAKQTLDWRKSTEDQELKNAADIARGAKKYAEQHDNAFPKDFAALLQGKYVQSETLLSPYGGDGTQYMSSTQPPPPAAAVAEHSDYSYCGSDLKLPIPNDAAAAIVVVYKTDPVMRVNFSAGFADGTAKFLTLEQAEKVLAACDDARKTLGLPPLQQPDSVVRALHNETQPQ